MPPENYINNPHIVNITEGILTSRIVLASPSIELDIPLYIMKCLFSDNYEGLETRTISLFYGEDKDDRVLEAGGGIGWTGVLLAQRTAHVTIYEPVAEYAKLIVHNMELNGLSNFSFHGAALGTSAGTRLFAKRHLVYASSFAELGVDSTAEETMVEIVGINEAIREAGANCLHLDVEGTEAELLCAADLTPIEKLCLEMHPHILGPEKCNWLIEYINDQGLIPLLITGYKLFPNQCYCIAFAREGAFRDRMIGRGYRDAGTITLTGLNP